ncbi:helix-turn-helix domain-containing protein (plasmid) [Streptomyces globisporus]|uniref:helix-turn-helix domain-containing protein n=1 Tax=Streptomyces globisporus TaxID=1908 RepID=UPI002F919B34|nr:helix-turn-helix domain-containing protein [Streptomyces globisporus]
MTHVLLPVSGLSRRADVVEVIGAALEMKAAGVGHRTIADRLGRAATTVRGWLRRFASRAGLVVGVFTSHLVALADDPSLVLPAPATSAFADAVAAVIACGIAVRSRFSMATAPIWRAASAVSRGVLLAPGWPSPTR